MDILERLRGPAELIPIGDIPQLLRDCRNEIERLRMELATAQRRLLDDKSMP